MQTLEQAYAEIAAQAHPCGMHTWLWEVMPEGDTIPVGLGVSVDGSTKAAEQRARKALEATLDRYAGAANRGYLYGPGQATFRCVRGAHGGYLWRTAA